MVTVSGSVRARVEFIITLINSLHICIYLVKPQRGGWLHAGAELDASEMWTFTTSIFAEIGSTSDSAVFKGTA
jgi:hypothetical protein